MSKIRKKLTSILVKPAGPDCNLNCKYCFYLEKKHLFHDTKVHRMSEDILEELIKQAMDQSDENISIAWQGGEPTLMGLDFFKKVVEFEEKYGYGKTVGNGLQTNGLLLNEEWADFLSKYNFLIGLSIDGPQHIHDKYRRTPNDKGSWEIVHRNAKMLLDRGVEVNAMTCVTDYSSQYAEEIYNFHKNLGLNFMQFIPILESDDSQPIAAEFSVSGEAYGKFLCEIFDLWYEDYKKGTNITSVRHIDSVFHRYVGMDAPECVLNKECGVYVVVEHNGNVYSCDFFVDPKWQLGNIMNSKMITMLNSKKQTQFGQIKSRFPAKCRKCQWLRYCYGGCTKDRIKDPRDKNHTHFCKSYMMFFNHTHERMLELARNWTEEQRRLHEQEMAKQNNQTYDASMDFVQMYKDSLKNNE